MNITFFINYLNHHQLPVADEMYRLLGDRFRFVATCSRNPAELKGGADYSSRPYCLLAAEDEAAREEAIRLNRESDVCVYGAGNLAWERERALTGKLSFEISERWFKRGLLNLLSPRLIRWWWLYQTKLRFKPFYKLCASAFTASDCNRLLAFRGRCFKWGYFTEPAAAFHRQEQVGHTDVVRIMWCARLIPLKHPETAVELADRLRKNGYVFKMSLYGGGPLRDKVLQMISGKQLENLVELKGDVSNAEVLHAMADADIFLFTSDRNEGWGAVVNEAMGCGCCVVGSNQIGSIPFLIQNENNGLIYKGGDIDSLYRKVTFLLEHPDRCREMGRQAAADLREIWSPKVAAANLLQLIGELQSGCTTTSITCGPCSKA
ncbi:MAG: glycosyltransferase [Coprobacter sp.]|nr:glycosyltransferase [Coprobacter sp.]